MNLGDGTDDSTLDSEPVDLTQDASGVPPEGAGSAADASPSGSAASSSVLGSFLRSREYDIPEDVNDDAILQQFETWAERAKSIPDGVDVSDLMRRAEAASEYEKNRERFEAWLQSQQQQPVSQPQAPVQQPAPPQNTSVNPTKLSQEVIAAYQQVCEFDPQIGGYKPKMPGFEAAAMALNQLNAARRSNIERFSTDPDEYIDTRVKTHAERLRDEIRQQIMQEFGGDLESFREFRAQQEQDAFIAPFRSELVSQGANGETLTAKGEKFREAFDSAPQGLTQLQRLEWARNQADAWAARQAAAPAPTPTVGFQLKKKLAAASSPAAPPQQQQPAAQAPAASPPPAAPVDKKKAFVDRGRHQSRDPGTGQFTADRGGSADDLPDDFAKIYQHLKRNGVAASN